MHLDRDLGHQPTPRSGSMRVCVDGGGGASGWVSFKTRLTRRVFTFAGLFGVVHGEGWIRFPTLSRPGVHCVPPLPYHTMRNVALTPSNDCAGTGYSSQTKVTRLTG